MYIHKLNKSTMGNAGRSTMRFKGMGVMGKVARHHKRSMGMGLKPEIFENGQVHKATETLRNMKVSKPRIPKKYISFDV